MEVNMNSILKTSTIRAQYLYIATVIVMYSLLWNIAEFLWGGYFNPSNQSYTTIITFFIIVSLCHITTHYLPCLLFARIKNINLVNLLRINKITLQQIILSFVIFIAYNLISVYLLITQDFILSYFNINFQMNDYIVAENVGALMVLILTVGILIPIGEEFFYRGFLIRGMENINKQFAIIASAFFFAIYHNNPHRLTTLFLFGVLLGLIVHYTNSLIPGIIMHVITNTVFVIYGFIQGRESMVNQYEDLSSSPVNLLNNNILLFLIFLISIGACIMSLKKLRNLAVKKINNYNILPANNRKIGMFFIIPAYIVITVVFLLRVMGYINISF